MKNLTVIVLIASLVFTLACEEKEEDLVLPKNINDVRMQGAVLGGDIHSEGPPKP